MTTQKRRHNRKVFERTAALDFGSGSASATCEVLDISDGGARLRPLMCAPDTLPERFTLLLSTCGKVRRFCHVVWRSRTELGVEFPHP